MQAPRPWRGPGANELAVDPELSALALLDAALAVTLEALPAFVPELDPQAATWAEASPVVLAARQIVVHGRCLRDLIDDYRHELDRRFVDDMPF
jgi:hypothetical protein